MMLNVRAAQSDEVHHAWPHYSEFVIENLFNGLAGRAARDKWDKDEELKRFTEYWRAADCYLIEIDDKIVGWLSMVSTPDKLTVENVFLAPEWQRKGIAERFFKEMTPVWRAKGLTVDVTLLKDGPGTAASSQMLRNLGYKAVDAHLLAENDGLTHVMRTG